MRTHMQCMRVRRHTHTWTHTTTLTHAPMHAHTHGCIQAHAHTHLNASTWVQTCTHARTQVHANMCTQACTQAHTQKTGEGRQLGNGLSAAGAKCSLVCSTELLEPHHLCACVCERACPCMCARTYVGAVAHAMKNSLLDLGCHLPMVANNTAHSRHARQAHMQRYRHMPRKGKKER